VFQNLQTISIPYHGGKNDWGYSVKSQSAENVGLRFGTCAPRKFQNTAPRPLVRNCLGMILIKGDLHPESGHLLMKCKNKSGRLLEPLKGATPSLLFFIFPEFIRFI
jgi:hypothetical protein